MRFSRRIPVAWLNLTHNKARFFLSTMGISFAVLLMLVQLGFWRALLDSQTAVIRSIDAELTIISSSMSTITDMQAFPRARVQQAKAVTGVASAKPLYIRTYPFNWKNGSRAQAEGMAPQWPIRVLAFVPDDEFPSFREDRMPGFREAQKKLTEPTTALIDRKSKPTYDAIRDWHSGEADPIGVRREVGGKSLEVVGFFDLGTDFTTDGNLLMTARNLSLWSGPDTLEAVQIGIVKLQPGVDAERVREQLSVALPSDVRVLHRDQLAAEEEDFWTRSTPIGFIFLLGLIVGFVVGVVICYQILATEVNDHLAEFATLKAIGYSDAYVAGIVLQEALWLSVMGFIAGLILGWPLYFALANQTGLPMDITLGRAGLILGLTVAMCILSGFLALRRVRTADPAEVFG